jgi:PAS domain S-box-containing protein
MPHTAPFDAPDFRAVFGELTGLYLLLSPDLRIVAASKAYLRATRQTERILGMPVFEAFPDSGDNGRDGAQALARSFERVLTHRTPDAMPLQRYDLTLPDGSVEVRYWSPVNTPVFDDAGRLGWILHRVFDVTAAASSAARDPRVGELEAELFQTASRLSTAYEALREGEARLRLALEVGGMAMWEYRLPAGALTITPEFNRLIGLAPDHPTTLAEVRSGFVDESETVANAARSAWSRGERVFEHEFRYRRHDDGRLIWLHLRAEIFTTDGSAPAAVLGVVEDVTERISVQERQRTLINELNHRVKNNLALVQSLAMRTFRGEGCEAALGRFVDRLIALAATHELLTRSDWRTAELSEVLAASFRGLSIPPDRVSLEGPAVGLPPDLAVAVSLAVHELTTNAIKYGALSTEAGRIGVAWTWDKDSHRLRLDWRERGGPPVRPPTRTGFGRELLGRIFRNAGGAVETIYDPDGVVCRMEMDTA